MRNKMCFKITIKLQVKQLIVQLAWLRKISWLLLVIPLDYQTTVRSKARAGVYTPTLGVSLC